jgi:hypothetical protein
MNQRHVLSFRDYYSSVVIRVSYHSFIHLWNQFWTFDPFVMFYSFTPVSQLLQDTNICLNYRFYDGNEFLVPVFSVIRML